jgi:hypothetical protein
MSYLTKRLMFSLVAVTSLSRLYFDGGEQGRLFTSTPPVRFHAVVLSCRGVGGGLYFYQQKSIMTRDGSDPSKYSTSDPIHSVNNFLTLHSFNPIELIAYKYFMFTRPRNTTIK